jgi:hypothetical protein
VDDDDERLGEQGGGVPEYRVGLWKIEFTAGDGQRAAGYTRAAAVGGTALRVMAAGRYGWSAVGAHEQVIALRDAVLRGGESFAITRAVFSELYPDGTRVQYEGADPEGFREQAERRLRKYPWQECGCRPAGTVSAPARSAWAATWPP